MIAASLETMCWHLFCALLDLDDNWF